MNFQLCYSVFLTSGARAKKLQTCSTPNICAGGVDNLKALKKLFRYILIFFNFLHINFNLVRILKQTFKKFLILIDRNVLILELSAHLCLFFTNFVLVFSEFLASAFITRFSLYVRRRGCFLVKNK